MFEIHCTDRKPDMTDNIALLLSRAINSDISDRCMSTQTLSSRHIYLVKQHVWGKGKKMCLVCWVEWTVKYGLGHLSYLP